MCCGFSSVPGIQASVSARPVINIATVSLADASTQTIENRTEEKEEEVQEGTEADADIYSDDEKNDPTYVARTTRGDTSAVQIINL